MFSLNDKVKILRTGIAGTIVDTYSKNGNQIYIVESDIADVKGGYGGKWKLFDCFENELLSLKSC